jgi:hypothetical protein
MIHLDFKGRLGNCLSQYAFARILAETKKFKLNLNYHNVLCHWPETLDVLKQFAYFSESVDGTEIHDSRIEARDDQYVDVNRLLSHNGLIFLDIYAQRFEYIKNNISDIKTWFSINKEIEDIADKPNDEDLVIHLRLEDYQALGAVLPPEVILEQAEKIKKQHNCKVGYIVTHDIMHPHVNLFKQYGFKHFNKSQIEDFIFLKHAKNLITSQSTFSWWAGFLGSGNVYLPLKDNTLWPANPKQTDIDLRVNDPRFFNFVF